MILECNSSHQVLFAFAISTLLWYVVNVNSVNVRLSHVWMIIGVVKDLLCDWNTYLTGAGG